MLERQIERIRRSKLIDQLLLATSRDSSDDPLEELASRLHIPCYRGSLTDVLDRFYQAARPFHPETVVRLTGDCPLVDSNIIDKTIQYFQAGRYDYASNNLQPTFPDGLDTEVFHFAALETAWKESSLASEREHVTLFIKNRPQRFRLGNLKNTDDLSQHRWTVDNPEDFEFVTKIYGALYPRNPEFGMNHILDLLQENPKWTSINSHIERNEGLTISFAKEKLKLALGGAQFGKDYGISNKMGKVSQIELTKIINLANESGIDIIDTAHTYGSSEEALGLSWPQKHYFRIVTKTCPTNAKEISDSDIQKVLGAFETSLSRLGVKSIYGLLVHDAKDLMQENSPRLFDALLRLKQAGKVEKLGASIYTGQEVDYLLEQNNYAIDLIQLPVNILDQRLLKSGRLKALKSHGIEIHARSAFLQGLLLTKPEEAHSYFRPILPILMRLHQELAKLNLSPIQGALQFLSQIPEIDRVIVGVTNTVELAEILEAVDILSYLPQMDFSPYAVNEEAIVNPAKWIL